MVVITSGEPWRLLAMPAVLWQEADVLLVLLGLLGLLGVEPVGYVGVLADQLQAGRPAGG